MSTLATEFGRIELLHGCSILEMDFEVQIICGFRYIAGNYFPKQHHLTAKITVNNKATRSPEISRQQVHHNFCFIYIGYRFPLSLSTIWGNHLPVNFPYMHIYNLEKPPPI